MSNERKAEAGFAGASGSASVTQSVQNGNEAPCALRSLGADRGTSNGLGCVHAGGLITPLLPLLASAWCKGTREYLRDHVARNSRYDAHLEAVINLWRSLGCPEDGFWRALLVDYSRIDVSYSGGVIEPNDQSQRRAPGEKVERTEGER